MFPADMIKVTILRVAPQQTLTYRVRLPTDTDAGLHRIAGSDVHRNRQRI